MLRHAGVLAGAVERRPRQLLMHELSVMRPHHGGLCVPRGVLTPGQWIDGGQPLADRDVEFVEQRRVNVAELMPRHTPSPAPSTRLGGVSPRRRADGGTCSRCGNVGGQALDRLGRAARREIPQRETCGRTFARADRGC